MSELERFFLTDKPFHHRAGQHCRTDGHNNERHKKLSMNYTVFEREQAENDFHCASGVHAESDSEGFLSGYTAQFCT